MADTTTSSNMGLPIPVVGTDPGPQWANDNNSCLTIIDAHNHSAGSGVQITPDGLNINSDLSFGTNSATNMKKVSFTSQLSALSGTNFVSAVNGNLYFNDGSGNQIAITSGGGVAGSPGSIGSLTSPAAATYSSGSKLFTWTADSGKAAAMDNGAVTIRETNVASAKGITLASPTSLGADYQLTLLPALPGSTQVINVGSSGSMGTVSYDGIGSAMTSTGADAIGATMSATGANAVAASRTRSTGTSVSAGGVAISSVVSGFSTTSTSYVDVSGVITIVTSGRPVRVYLGATNGASSSYIRLLGPDVSQCALQITDTTGAFSRAAWVFTNEGLGDAQTDLWIPPSGVDLLFTGTAATYTFKLRAKVFASSSTVTFACNDIVLIAYEL